MGYKEGTEGQERGRDRQVVCILGIIFLLSQIVLNLLKYYNLNTDVSDFGGFQNLLWNIGNDYSYITFLFGGHFYPSLLFYLLFYKLLPYAETLIVLQSLGITLGLVPLYLLARDVLDDRYALTVSLMYVLFPYNWFVSLYPFHPDHLAIPLGILLFYFLQKDNLKGMILTSLFLTTCRELFFFSASFFFVFYAIHKRRYKIGFGLAIIFFLMGILYVDYITPLIHPKWGTIVKDHPAIGYLGTNMHEIIMNILTRPLIVLEQVLKLEKVLTISGFFGFFLLIPLISPFALTPALPALAMALLSRMPQYYLMIFHYSAGATPFVFGAFVLGLKRLRSYLIKGKRTFNLLRYVLILNSMIVFIAYFIFFSIIKYTDYNIEVFNITKRSLVIREAIHKYIPTNPQISLSVTTDTNLNRLVNRELLTYFPAGIIEPAKTFRNKVFTADYAVVDTRPVNDTARRYLRERGAIPDDVIKSQEELNEGLNFALENYNIIFHSDGFYIFNRSKR